MEVNNSVEIKDGCSQATVISLLSSEAPPIDRQQNLESVCKKKRRRGKSKRKITKPYMKASWQERRKNEKSKRNNRFRKMVLAKTHAPFNNNQFLMEIHKPDPENNFQILQTPARTRDSSFSVESDENYFYSLPEDEEEYLTKEFSSVYEDAQSERLSSMSKDDLIREYLLLEAKYDNLIKRTERMKQKESDSDKYVNDKDTSVTDKDSMLTETEKDTSGTSVDLSEEDATSVEDLMRRVKEQDDQIRELQISNENLRLELECLRQRSQVTSSEDSESDSSSTSMSSSSSNSRTSSPVNETKKDDDLPMTNGHINGQNGFVEDNCDVILPHVNGFHNLSDTCNENDL